MEVIITLIVFLAVIAALFIQLNKKRDYYKINLKKGKKYYDEQQYDNALECYEYISLRDETNIWAYYGQGLCFIKMKKYDDAIKMAEKFISLDDSMIYGYLLRMVANFELQNSLEVIGDADKVLSIDENNEEALQDKACSYYNLKKYEEAAESYKKLIEVIKRSPEVSKDPFEINDDSFKVGKGYRKFKQVIRNRQQ